MSKSFGAMSVAQLSVLIQNGAADPIDVAQNIFQTIEDYPDKAAEFATINMMVRQTPGGMTLSRIPIPPIPDHLKQVIEEQKS